MSATPIGHAVYLVVAPPASKKNRRRWVVRGGKRFLLPSAEAVSSEKGICIAAKFATRGQMPFDEFDAVQISCFHDLPSDRVHVKVVKIGELPKRGRGTKRDLHGMVETIADALQGVVYPNDNQVDEVFMMRVRPAAKGKR